MDCAAAPSLHDALQGPRPAAGVVVVDLGEVTLLSAAALTVLMEAHLQFTTDGGRLLLTHPTRLHRRVFAIVALDQVHAIGDEVSPATAGGAGPPP